MPDSSMDLGRGERGRPQDAVDTLSPQQDWCASLVWSYRVWRDMRAELVAHIDALIFAPYDETPADHYWESLRRSGCPVA